MMRVSLLEALASAGWTGGAPQVNGLLGVEPELGRGPKRGAQPQGYFGGHGGTTIDDAVDDLDIATEVIASCLSRMTLSQGGQR